MHPQSIFEPASRAAELMENAALVLFIGGAAIFVFVMVLVVWGAMSGPKEIDRRRWIVLGGIAFPVVVLTCLLIYGLGLGAALSHDPQLQAMRIEVIGKRWWWEVRYETPNGSGWTVLANELHLPVGCVAELTLTTSDVIHSFWVPALAGKVDMIPGHRNRLVLHANREGVYRGQCAEFCGDQHAKMAFEVVVESPEAFRAWLARQVAPAAEPVTALHERGRDAFFQGGCATCHTIRGTTAAGQLGPDLTHVGSRRTIAAGVLRTHRASLAGWIVGAQTVKPGNLMPSMGVYDGEELLALSAYLVSLQ
jgi:cytochrome c oxidase subunit 2